MKICTSFRRAHFDGKSGEVATFVAVLALTAAFLCCLPGLCLGGNSGSDAFSSVPLTFTQNQGQWPDDILFQANGGGAGIWITSTGVYYQFTRQIENASADVDDDPATIRDPRVSDESDRTETMVIKAAFVGANPNPEVVAEGLMDYKCNYFLGNDPAKWRTDVPNYSSIVLKDIYPGIDVRFSENAAGRFSYQYDIAAWANVDQVQFEYEGPAEVAPDATGRMTAKTAWGDISGLLGRPSDNADPGFAATSHIPAYTDSRAVGLVYSTFLGGSKTDRGSGIAVDGSGCAYVTGITLSSNFPRQSAYDASYNGGQGDAFVTKFSAAGNTVVYSTYLGGAGLDRGFGIAVDSTGYVYVTGGTESANFPTYNAYDASYNGAGAYYGDAFVTKFSAAGNSLSYSTYLGGSTDDYGSSIAVGLSGGSLVACVTGSTRSTNFPMSNAFDSNIGYDEEDAFVTKFSGTGMQLIYSTYLGGSNKPDCGYGIAMDATGSAYVTGYTQSPDFPTQNAYDASLNDVQDAFVTKLSASGNSLGYSTYLGSSSGDVCYAIAVDGSLCAYVTGYTGYSDYPTKNAYDASWNAGYDAVVTKFSAAGDSLVYSTYLGGSAKDIGWGIDVDGSGCAYVAGFTKSTSFPTRMAYDASLADTAKGDAFVTKLAVAGSGLVYSTYLGGDKYDCAAGVAVDGAGCTFVTGNTLSFYFPTYNAYTNYLYSLDTADCFVTKLSALPDRDADSVLDAVDNCPDNYNPGQEDADSDGVGDACCCICPTLGNLDNSEDCLVTMGDLTVLIDHLYESLTPLTCLVAGNLDLSADGLVTQGDLAVLIDHLFISLAPLPECP